MNRTADAEVVRGGIDSMAWLVDNARNWQTERWRRLRDAAWKDRDAALAALDRLVAGNGMGRETWEKAVADEARRRKTST